MPLKLCNIARMPDNLECHVSLVEAWVSGRMEIPLKASAWLTTFTTCHRAAEKGRPTSVRVKKPGFKLRHAQRT